MFFDKFHIYSQIEFEKMDMKKLTEVEELQVTSGSVKKEKEKDAEIGSNVVMVLRKIANHPLLVRCVQVTVIQESASLSMFVLFSSKGGIYGHIITYIYHDLRFHIALL